MNSYPRYYLAICFLFPFLLSFGQKSGTPFAKADSLFFKGDYQPASLLYQHLLTDTSRDGMHLNRYAFSLYNLGNYPDAEKYYTRALSSNPIPPVKASVLSRLARIRALKNDKPAALTYLDSAINSGYMNFQELDSLNDFQTIRNDPAFTKLRDRLFNSIYPCFNNPHDREFDFWIGEWDVYQTGTQNLAGHSLIQKISGGCAILENWNSSVSEGKSINYVDDSTNKWKQVWVGSYPNGKQDFLNGEYTDSAMRFSYVSRNAQGHSIIGRLIFYNLGPGQVRQFSEYSADEGKSWITSYDFMYLRKK